MRKALGRTIAATIVAGCVGPAAASAETITIGSALQNPSNPAVCTSAGCLGVQVTQIGGNSPFPLTAPVTGRITSYSVRTGDPDTTFTLRVLRQNGSGPMGPNYTALASSAASPPVPPGTTDSVIPYPVSVPISQGNSIGVTIGGLTDGLPQYTSANNSDVMAYMTNLSDGASQDSFANGMHELNLQATIKSCKVPTLTGLTEAAAIAGLTPADCTAGNVTRRVLKLKKKTKKNRKKNKAIRAQNGIVLSQAATPSTNIDPATPVSFEVGQLVKKKKKKKKKK